MEVIPMMETVVLVIAAALTIHYLYKYSRKNTAPKLLVDPTEKYPLRLSEILKVSHDTNRFRFELPSEKHILGLPTGQHIRLSAEINNEVISRSYTPITSDEDYGYVDLIVKIYRRNSNPKFPEGGKMSQYLESLQVGDKVEVIGPLGRLKYLGNGKFSIKSLQKDPPTIIKTKKVNMIAGGTGITPMLQIIKHICKDPRDDTVIALLFANQTENDILLRDELEKIAFEHPEELTIWYTLDSADKGWPYSTGFVNDEMISEHLYPPGDDTIVLMCGPPPMIRFACNPSLDKLGYSPSLRYVF